MSLLGRPRSLRLLATLLLAATALVALAHPPGAYAESRIVVREGARRVVAISPTDGQAETLARIRHGAILGTAAAGDGSLVAFASRTFHEVDGEHVWTDRIWILRPGGEPHLIRTIKTVGLERASLPIDSLALSSHGKRLVIETRGGPVETMLPDGTGRRPVVSLRFLFGLGEGRNSTRPQFTPDGERILGVFYPPSGRPTAIGGIGTVARTGGPVNFLVRGPFADGVGNFLAPTFSLDGRRLAYVLRRRSDSSIWVADRDGSGARRVALLPGWRVDNPSFSPSGRSLTFVGTHPEPRHGGTVIGKSPAALFTVRLDGTHLRVLQREPARLFGRDPTWVPWP
jgi:WD40-like Beta Propeller Repeat